MIQKKFTILLFMFSLFNLSAQNKVVVDLNTNTLSTNDYTQNETEINGTFYKKLNEKFYTYNQYKIISPCFFQLCSSKTSNVSMIR